MDTKQHEPQTLTEADIERAYLLGYQDGRTYACAVLSGLECEQRPDGYWTQRREELRNKTPNA